MRKISFTPTIKRGAYSLLALVGLVLVGLGIANADSLTVGEAQVVEYSGEGIHYDFTAPSTGVLKVTLSPAAGYAGVNYGAQAETEILYTAAGVAVPSVSNNGTDVGAPFLTNVTEATFNVTEGESYFVKFPYWEGTVLVQMAEEPTDPDPGPGGDVPTGGALETGTAYPSTSDAPVVGTISFDSNGVLTASFSEEGSALSAAVWEPILFEDENHENQVAFAENPSNGKQTYNVTAGTTYYVLAGVAEQGLFGTEEKPGYPLGYAYEVTFSFQAGGGTTDPEPGPGDDSDWEKAEIGKTYTIADGDDLRLSFTTETAGELLINQWGASESIVYTIPSEDPEDWTNRVIPEYMGENPSACTYNLDAGKTYYIFVKHDNAAYLECSQIEIVSYTSAGGGGTDPEPTPGDGYADMAMQSYTVSGVGGVMLKYTPDSDGVLTVVQTGSFDSHLFSAPPVYDDSYGYDNNYGIMISPDGGDYTGENPYTLKYTLSKGETYYFVAKTASGDGLNNVTFSWVAAQTGGDYVINEGEVTAVAANTLYEFTPSDSGILTVETSNGYAFGSLHNGDNQFFFYKNPAHSQAVPMLKAPEDGEQLVGYTYFFEVTGGETYYVYSEIDCNFLFTVANETVVPKFTGISGIEAVPGGAIGRDAQEATFGLDFEPQGVTITSVDFIYTDASGVQQTVKNVEFSMGGGKYQIPLPLHFDSNGTRLSTGDGTGSVMGLISGAEIYYQINGMSYNGTEVNESAIANGVEMLGDGAMKLKFLVANPVKLVSYTLPSPFLQYWPVGSGDATATFTFDGDITGRGDNGSIEISVNKGNLVFGSVGGEEPVSVSIPWDNASIETVDDGDNASHSVLTVNFAGVDMTSIPAGSASVVLTGVSGTDGLLANMNVASSAADGSGAFYTTMVTAEIPEGTVTVKGTTPAVGEELTVDENGNSTFTIEFSDNAKITKAYAPTKPEYTDCEFAIVTGDSDTGYGTVWSVTFPASYVEDMVNDGLGLSCNIEAESENGTPIAYGNNELIVLNFAPDASLSAGVDFEVLVAESAVGTLDTFSVLVPTGYSYITANDYNTGYENPYQGITITGPNGFEAHPVPDAYADGVVTFTPGITESGTYTINFPLNAFTIGSEAGEGAEGDATKMSAAKTIEFVVTISQETQAVVTLTPDSGSGIDIAADGTVSFVLTASQPVCLTEYKYGMQGSGDLTVTPTPGADVFETNYTLTFPKSYIDEVIYGWNASSGLPRTVFATLYIEDENGDKVVRTGEDGSTYDDFSVYFTLNTDASQGAPFGVKVDDAAKGSLSSFEVYALEGFSYVDANDVTYWDDEAQTDVNYYRNITITGENGFTANAVALPTEENEEGEEVPVFNGTVTFEPAITESGTYTITIPYHAFTVGMAAEEGGEGDVNYWSQFMEVEFTVLISETTGVEYILGVEGACKVYNLNGILVLDTDNAADLNQLENGIYIVNGKKVMIRK